MKILALGCGGPLILVFGLVAVITFSGGFSTCACHSSVNYAVPRQGQIVFGTGAPGKSVRNVRTSFHRHETIAWSAHFWQTINGYTDHVTITHQGSVVFDMTEPGDNPNPNHTWSYTEIRPGERRDLGLTSAGKYTVSYYDVGPPPAVLLARGSFMLLKR